MLFIFERICSPKDETFAASLKAVLLDAMYCSIMVGLGETFLSTYGIALGGSSLQIGFLSTVPPLFGAVTQLFGLFILRKGFERIPLIFTGALTHGLVWIGAAALALSQTKGPEIVWIVMLLAAIQQMSGSIIAPAWNSLVGDIVPPSIRGRFFGFRNQRSGWITVAFTIFGGTVLHLFRIHHDEFLGFAALFFIAGLARVASAHWLQKYPEPGYSIDQKDQFSLWSFIKRTPHSNFAKFVLFYALMNGSASMAGPYISLYILRDLHFSYFQFSIISASQLMTQYFFMRNWGKLLDEFGSKRILTVCGIAVCFTTSLLLVSSNFWFFIATQIYSGMFWAGFNLASFNFMFDAVTPQKRAQCAAYMSLMNGISICAGAYLGGLIVTHTSDTFLIGEGIFTPPSVYLKVFLISCLARGIIAAIMLPKFKEVREVAHIKTRELIFRISAVRPITGATFAFIAQSIRKDD